MQELWFDEDVGNTTFAGFRERGLFALSRVGAFPLTGSGEAFERH